MVPIVRITSKHFGDDWSDRNDLMETRRKQLLDEVEHDIVNYQNRGLCSFMYNNCFIIHKEVMELFEYGLPSLFLAPA